MLTLLLELEIREFIVWLLTVELITIGLLARGFNTVELWAKGRYGTLSAITRLGDVRSTSAPVRYKLSEGGASTHFSQVLCEARQDGPQATLHVGPYVKQLRVLSKCIYSRIVWHSSNLLDKHDICLPISDRAVYNHLKKMIQIYVPLSAVRTRQT